MRFPQVSERVKEAPANALRAVFASIGQVLLVTDRMKNKPAEAEQAASPRTDEPAADATPAAETTPVEETTPTAETTPAETAPAVAAATATLPPPAEPAPESPVPASAAESTAPETVATEAPEMAAEAPVVTEPRPPAAPAPAATEPAAERAAPEAAGETTAPETAPPLPNYEQLTIASLRARLRGLTVVQVRELIVYERAHAARPDVISMFERRVTKLETPEG